MNFFILNILKEEGAVKAPIFYLVGWFMVFYV